MVNLTNNWITEGHIDFEYKKYLVLAYLKQTQDTFAENKLYPQLSELLNHYKSLIDYKNGSHTIEFGSQKRISSLDFLNTRVIYETSLPQHELIDEVNRIIDFSIPLFYSTICDGKELFLKFESLLSIQSIGIKPLNLNEGYCILKDVESNQLEVFYYALSFYKAGLDNNRILHTRHIASFKQNVKWNPESTKQYLISQNKELPNPAVFYIESRETLPFVETYLPLAKRYLVSKLAA